MRIGGRSGPTRWLLPKSALQASIAEMAIDGIHNREGVALWLGCREGPDACITHIAVLRGQGVIKEPDHLEIDSDLFNQLTDVALNHAVLLIGQIHSHGAGWTTDLSVIDHLGGLHVPGFLSVVAPDYALRSDTHIADCGVHVYERATGYRRLPLDEVLERITMVDQKVEILKVAS